VLACTLMAGSSDRARWVLLLAGRLGAGSNAAGVVVRPRAEPDGTAKDHAGARAMMRAWMPGFASATGTPPSPSTRLLAICLQEGNNGFSFPFQVLSDDDVFLYVNHFCLLSM